MKHLRYTVEDLLPLVKDQDAWWTVLVIDPFALRIAVWVASAIPGVWPNHITLISFAVALAAAICFASGWLIAGALLTQLAFTLDCVDGKVASLTGRTSAAGGMLDFLLDCWKVFCYGVGLVYGLRRESMVWWVLGLAFVFFDIYSLIPGLYHTALSARTAHPSTMPSTASKRFWTVWGKWKVAVSRVSPRLVSLPTTVEAQVLAFFVTPIVYAMFGARSAVVSMALAAAVAGLSACVGTVGVFRAIRGR